MKPATRSNPLILLILMILLTALSGQSLAAEVTLQEAVNQGLAQNSEIRAARNNVMTLKRELALLAAEQDWQVELGAATLGEDSVDVSISKSFASGLTISPKLSWTINNQESTWSVTATQPLYPLVPSSTAQKYFTMEQDLLKAKAKLTEVTATQTLSWLESYLSIIRTSEKIAIYRESAEKAKAQLARVQKRRALGDVGEVEGLTAELSLQEAKYKVQASEQQLAEALLALRQELGLQPDQELVLTESNQYLTSIHDRVAKLTAQYSDHPVTEFAAMAEQASADLVGNRIDNTVLSQELEWVKRDGRASLDLIASHDNTTTESTVGLSLTYRVSDGGTHDLQVEAKANSIELNHAEYEDLRKSLRLELTRVTNAIELTRSGLVKEELSQKKAQHEAEVAEEQLRVGLIDYLEYQDYWIASKESSVNLKSLQDQLLIYQLKLFASIGGLLGDTETF